MIFAIIFVSIIFLFNAGWGFFSLAAILYLYFGLFISVNIHEFGHFLIGKKLGYILLAYQIIFFSWLNMNGKMKFSFQKTKNLGGLCAMMPPEGKFENNQAFFYAAGIMFNLLTAVVFLIPFIFIFELTAFWFVFFLNVAGCSLMMGIINLIPCYIGNIPNDGEILWSIILKKPFVQQMIIIQKISAQLIGGIRPRDLQVPEETFKETACDDYRSLLSGYFKDIDAGDGKPSVKPAGEDKNKVDFFENRMYLYRYFHALDSGNISKASEFADYIENHLNSFPPFSLHGIYNELCFIGCISDNPARAKIYYKKAGRNLQKDMDINGMRTKAYYSFYIDQNKDAAIAACEKGLAAADKFPVKGQRVMEVDLIKQLQAKIKENL